jgi:hypothetical protein
MHPKTGPPAKGSAGSMTDGLCECGCGGITNVLDGRHKRFIHGHHNRGQKWPLSSFEKRRAKGWAKKKAVLVTYRREGQTRAHRIRAEKALGHPLPPKAVIHHADGTKSERSTLVICQDHAYHMLLHRRMRILKAGGDPNRGDRVCSRCHRAKPPSMFKGDHRCLECKSKGSVALPIRGEVA